MPKGQTKTYNWMVEKSKPLPRLLLVERNEQGEITDTLRISPYFYNGAQFSRILTHFAQLENQCNQNPLFALWLKLTKPTRPLPGANPHDKKHHHQNHSSQRFHPDP